MMQSIRYLFPLGLAVLLASCATVPKPQELVLLEELREGKKFQKIQEEQAELAAESDKAHQQALEAWQDEEIELAKHYATLGSIKLRTAQAIISQEEARSRLKSAKNEYQETQQESAELELRIKEAEEKIALYDKLSSARTAAQEKEKELSEAQKLGEAQKKLDAAQLALKTADTVEASKYAQTSYDLAMTMLQKAQAAMKAGNASEASVSAELAKSKAEEAYQGGRAQYLKDKESAQRQAQNQAMQKDAAAIPGITLKVQAAGQTQQLVMPIPDLFKARSTTPRTDKVHILTAIGELLKKYPSYPVIINGYTSFRVGGSQRYSVSQARAQQVATHFVTMGIPLKRFAVAGLGAENLLARRWSTLNDRVEIILLFE